MIEKLVLKMAAVAAVSAIVLAAAPAAAVDPGTKPDAAVASVPSIGPARGGVVVEITNLQPFTHIAYIPVGAALSSIRFESVKAVKVATTRTSTADKGYCEGGSQEPGGSMYCPYMQDVSTSVPAYQITYSFGAPPMASDEYGNTDFTFSVNMRPEDLSPAILQLISARKISRKTAAEYFKLTTSRGLVQRIVIDDEASGLCDGNFSDGVWTHTNPNCQDSVTYKTVTVPSDYIAAKVDGVSPAHEAVTADTRRP
jgi:hypothetical protein